MMPNVPPSPFKAAGQEVILVSMRSGRVSGAPGFDKIRELKSFVSLESDVTTGSLIERSIDLFTSLGSAFLMHEDPQVLAADVNTIRAMETAGTLLELDEDKNDCVPSDLETESTGASSNLEAENTMSSDARSVRPGAA